MKLINGAALRELPAGTIYQRYINMPGFAHMLTHRGIGPLFEKGEEHEDKDRDTFLCMPLIGVFAVNADNHDESVDMFEQAFREELSMPVELDRWYPADIGRGELAMVWEDADVALLISRLEAANTAKFSEVAKHD